MWPRPPGPWRQAWWGTGEEGSGEIICCPVFRETVSCRTSGTGSAAPAPRGGAKSATPKICHFGKLIISNYSYLRDSWCQEDTLTSFVLLKAGNPSPGERCLPCCGRERGILQPSQGVGAEKAVRTTLALSSLFGYQTPLSCHFFTNLLILFLKGVKAVSFRCFFEPRFLEVPRHMKLNLISFFSFESVLSQLNDETSQRTWKELFCSSPCREQKGKRPGQGKLGPCSLAWWLQTLRLPLGGLGPWLESEPGS